LIGAYPGDVTRLFVIGDNFPRAGGKVPSINFAAADLKSDLLVTDLDSGSDYKQGEVEIHFQGRTGTGLLTGNIETYVLGTFKLTSCERL
jgi:hypothetical protein